MTAQTALDLLLGGISLGGIYALVAFALSLSLATTHVLNVAHGTFMVLGAALATLLRIRWKADHLFAVRHSFFLKVGARNFERGPLRRDDAFRARHSNGAVAQIHAGHIEAMPVDGLCDAFYPMHSPGSHALIVEQLLRTFARKCVRIVLGMGADRCERDENADD